MAGEPAGAPSWLRRRAPAARPPAYRHRAHCFSRSHACMQAAAQYIEEHNLQKVVEDAINATIKEKPAEPFSYMVRRPPR